MVKYIHCEKCKKIYSTETWIGEIHSYTGLCVSCTEEEQQENQKQQETVKEYITNKNDSEDTEKMQEILENTKSSSLDIEKNLLSSLDQKANDVLSGVGSIDVLIKEIKDGLIDKAKDRIGETIQSFDAGRIDAQKVVEYAEKTFDYLSEYKEFMDNVVVKLQTKSKMKVKTAIEKVYKESIVNIPKEITKDALLNKKATLKNIFGKASKWHDIYSDTKDVYELTKKMVTHPFIEIQKKFNTLPFYN
ncbi:MAG: hypothetical protein ACFFC3_04465 [Candidatus Odinarchaeota archaeon]